VKKLMKQSHTNWLKVGVFSAVVGLLCGCLLWLSENYWQKSADNRIVSSENYNRRVRVSGTKPVVLNDDLPETDPILENLGDKLAEASFHLHEKENDLARQSLAEAAQIADKTEPDDAPLHDRIVITVHKAQTELNEGKAELAAAEINSLIDRLNVP
jgi:hypothetical protein